MEGVNWDFQAPLWQFFGLVQFLVVRIALAQPSHERIFENPMLRMALIAGLLALGHPASAAAQAVLVRWAGQDGTVVAQRELTLADLDALPQAAIDTSTPWSEGVVRFTGPPPRGHRHARRPLAVPGPGGGAE